MLASFLENFKDENTQVQLQLLTAIVKLFLKRPTDTQSMVQSVLNLATQESDNPGIYCSLFILIWSSNICCSDLRDRGFIYWRLLSTDPEAAKAVVLAEKPLITDTTSQLDDNLLNDLIPHISTLASVYHKPPESFVTKLKGLSKGGRGLKVKEDEDEEESEYDHNDDDGMFSIYFVVCFDCWLIIYKRSPSWWCPCPSTKTNRRSWKLVGPRLGRPGSCPPLPWRPGSHWWRFSLRHPSSSMYVLLPSIFSPSFLFYVFFVHVLNLFFSFSTSTCTKGTLAFCWTGKRNADFWSFHSQPGQISFGFNLHQLCPSTHWQFRYPVRQEHLRTCPCSGRHPHQHHWSRPGI